MPYRNPYPQGTPRNRMFAYAAVLARRFVRQEPRLEVGDLVHACILLMPALERSWNPRRGSIETWAFRPFRKVMNACKRGLAPVGIGERRVVEASRIGRFEREREVLVGRLARCSGEEMDRLLAKLVELGHRIDTARTDAAARVGGAPRGREGEPLSLEETVAAPSEPMAWELRRQWERVERSLSRLPVRDETLVRMICIGHLPSRIAGPACGISHARASQRVRFSLERLRDALGSGGDQDLLDEV